MVQHLPGTRSNTVRAGELWTYMETHQLHESLWYGHALRDKHKHHTSVLDHPLPDERDREKKSFVCQPRSLHLKTACSLEEVVDLSASCGFLDAEGAATERAPAVEYMHDGDTDGENSGASDYGTLA